MSDYDEDTMREMATLSDAAYKPGTVPEGWQMDNELSNENRSVFHRDGKAVVAYRGTDLSGKKNEWKDLGTDALITLGLGDLSSSLRNAKKTAYRAQEKYGKENVTLTGHSLGGSSALYAHTKTGLETHAFNPGVSPLDVKRSEKAFSGVGNLLPMFKKLKYGKNAHSYVIKHDLISSFSPELKGVQTHTVTQTHKNPHSLTNFLKK